MVTMQRGMIFIQVVRLARLCQHSIHTHTYTHTHTHKKMNLQAHMQTNNVILLLFCDVLQVLYEFAELHHQLREVAGVKVSSGGERCSGLCE